ncbi:MAG: hypothetical protein PVG33_13195, partial [Chloroflexota bacterium]
DLWAGQDGFGAFPLYADNATCVDRSGLSSAECETLNVVDLVNAALTDPGDDAEYRQQMLELASYLDYINNYGSDYFDWNWGLEGPA